MTTFGGSDAQRAPAVRSGSAGAPGTDATRWWSVPGASVGSRIDASDPEALAAGLHPSRNDYCLVLRQTLQAGKSILPDATASSPALRISAEAFISELTALAPDPVHAAWRTAGAAVLALVDSAGNLSAVHISDSTAVSAAMQSISADATSACKLTVTS